jgi:hypothetical protein
MPTPDRPKLDIHDTPKAAPATHRPFISVLWSCCGVYARIYRSPDGSAYNGRCPRCGKPVKFAIGPGGTDCRSFVVH